MRYSRAYSIFPKESKKNSKKPSAKKKARRRASIRERLNSYVRNYSVDLQNLFDDIVATASPETESNNINPGGTENQANQSRSTRIAVYGAQYLKERLGIMLTRAKISVMPLTKKGSKKQSVKRKIHAKLLDKLNILRKKFQLMKKDASCLADKQKSSPCPTNPVKKIRKKRKKQIKKQDKKNKTKSKKEARKAHTRNLKIKKKQGIRRRLGSVG